MESLVRPLHYGQFDDQLMYERKAFLSYTIQLCDVEPARYQHVIHKYLKKMVKNLLYHEKRIPMDLVNYICTFLPRLCLQGLPFYIPSHLFLYYNARGNEGDPREDEGVSVCNAVGTASQKGACEEFMFPYLENNLFVQPPDICYERARFHRVTEYKSVIQFLPWLKRVLARGFPIICGISIYSSFMSTEVAETGIVPLPVFGKDTYIGGHCILLIGYDDNSKHFMAQNSWSKSWGDQGFFTLPYSYLEDPNLANDFYCILKVFDN
jgi:hypothetical protein